MTVKSKRGWTIAAVLLALLIIVATFPMRLALQLAGAEKSGFTAREVVGPVWWAGIGDARIGALPLGNLDAWLAPGPLLAGRAELGFSRQDERLGLLSGRLRVGALRGVTELNGAISMSSGIGLIPVDTVRMEGVEALFDAQGRCQSAQGRVQLMVGGTIAGLDLSRGLSGTLACRGNRAETALVSQSGMEKLVLSFDGSGAYRARLAIRVDRDPVMAAALAALGFRAANDGFAMVSSGTF